MTDRILSGDLKSDISVIHTIYLELIEKYPSQKEAHESLEYLMQEMGEMYKDQMANSKESKERACTLGKPRGNEKQTGLK
jgi:hypothetical protein